MSKIIDEEKTNNKTSEKGNTLKVDVPRAGDAVGIRASLRNMGFSDSAIGYDNASGMVTLDGKAFMKPTYLDDEAGVSYAPIGDIRKNLVNYYKKSDNPIVRVSDAYSAAAGKYGLSADALSYGNGTVSIGGAPLNTLYIDDSGKAWAWLDDVNALTEQYIKKTGVEDPKSLLSRYQEEYFPELEDAIEKLMTREEFSYDPDSDPVYKAYMTKYMQEGERASRNAIADYSALTGGYTNSAAVTAGALANQYYANQLTSVIPELAEQAYQRYYDSYRTDLDLIDKVLDAYDTAYDNAYKANQQLADNINYSAKSSVERDLKAYDREQKEFERYWDELFNQQKYDTQERENYWTEVLNPIEQTSGLLDNYKQEIYNEYYRQLIESELEGSKLDNKKTEADIRRLLWSIGY